MPDGFEATDAAPEMGDYTIHGDAGKLFDALAKAQGKIRNAAKESENPHFRSKYADLASVADACREALSAHGIAVIQVPHNDGKDIAVTTILGHSSGARISGKLKVQPGKWDAQGVGSVVTYLRRYALAAMTGVAPAAEDDDGEAAVGRGQGGAPGEMGAPSARAPARRAAPKPPADESADKAAAREKFARILAAIKTAPNEGVLQNVMDDAKEDIAFVRKHGGNEAALSIATKAEERRRDLQTGGPSEEGARAVTRAAIRVKERSFQDFLGVQGEAAADEALKRRLNIQSKREIGTNPKALAAFKRLEGEAEDYARFGPSPSEAAE